MGLDVVAYSNIEVVDYVNNDDEDFWNSIWESNHLDSAYINYDFPHTLNVNDIPAGSRDVIYRASENSERFSFRAGSYSSYNQFRKTLCLGKRTPEDMWEQDKKNPLSDNIPFSALINFSDCEGCFINQEIMTLLAKQFKKNLEKYATYVKSDFSNYWPEYLIDTYVNFSEAFTLGAQNGIVVFR